MFTRNALLALMYTQAHRACAVVCLASQLTELDSAVRNDLCATCFPPAMALSDSAPTTSSEGKRIEVAYEAGLLALVHCSHSSRSARLAGWSMA